MIRAGTLTKPSPQQALAATLGGTILGPNAILVDGHLIVASLRYVRCDGVRVGCWDDGTDVLAARCHAVIDGRRVDLGPAPGPVAVAVGGAPRG